MNVKNDKESNKKNNTNISRSLIVQKHDINTEH